MLNAVKDVTSALSDLINQTKTTSGNPNDDTSNENLKSSAKVCTKEHMYQRKINKKTRLEEGVFNEIAFSIECQFNKNTRFSDFNRWRFFIDFTKYCGIFYKASVSGKFSSKQNITVENTVSLNLRLFNCFCPLGHKLALILNSGIAKSATISNTFQF